MLIQEELLSILLRLLELLTEHEIVVVVHGGFPKLIVLVDVLVSGKSEVLVQREDADDGHSEVVNDEHCGVLAPTRYHVTLG